MQVVVTGGTGFVGSHWVRAMVAKGVDVTLIVRPTSDLSILQGCQDRCHVVVYDGQMESLLQGLEGRSIDVLYHLATHFVIEHQACDLDALIDGNVRFGLHLLEASRLFAIRHWVNVGTIWQCFQDNAYNPVNLYAATKQAFEDLAFYYHEAERLNMITLQLTNTYGPHDPRRKLLHALCHTDGRLSMSPGGQKVDYVYIDDVLSALDVATHRLLAQDQPAFECYQVAGRHPVSLKHFVALCQATGEVRCQIEWGGKPYRSREVMESPQGEVLPNWRPKIGLEEGLARTLKTMASA